MAEGDDTSEFQTADVEKRIGGEFMRQLQKSDVDFQLTEIMEGQLKKEDFGGCDEISELIEAEVLENED